MNERPKSNETDEDLIRQNKIFQDQLAENPSDLNARNDKRKNIEEKISSSRNYPIDNKFGM